MLFRSEVTNGQIQFTGYKLEEGNVATDWTPAPEDVPSSLSIGGRNLIVRTGEIVGKMIGMSGEISSIAGSSVTPAIIKVTPGEPLTMSGTAGDDNYFRYAFYDEAGNTITREYAYVTPATTVIAPAESATFRISYPRDSKVKLERGNVATDWSPAPEDIDSAIAKAQTTADTASTNVNNLKQKVDGLGQTNQLFNTEFKPDYSGWTINEPRGSHRNKLNMAYNGSTIFEYDSRTGGGIANSGSVWLISDEIPINYGSPLSMSVVAKTIFVPTDETTSYFVAQPRFTLKDGTAVFGDDLVRFKSGDNNSDWVYGKIENIQIPANTVSVCLYSWIRGAGVVVRLAQPMLVFDNKIGDYVAGNYYPADTLKSTLMLNGNNMYVGDNTYMGTNTFMDGITLAGKNKVNDITDTDWLDIPLAEGRTGTAKYKVSLGKVFVHLDGVKGVTATGNNAQGQIGTLPVNPSPYYTRHIGQVGSTIRGITINPDGVIYVANAMGSAMSKDDPFFFDTVLM